MDSVLTLFLLLTIPVLLKVFEKTKLVSTLSPIAIAYALGILLSFSPLNFNLDHIRYTSEISITLSICLFVLASNLSKFKVLLKPVLKSFVLGIISLIGAILLTFYLIDFEGLEKNKILGMLVGVYVGGTPNLNAIGYALGVTNETLVIVNTAEMLLGGAYFFLLITLVKPILSLFLPKFKSANLITNSCYDTYTTTSYRDKITMIILALLASILILILSYGLVQFLFGATNVPALLISLTTLSVLLSPISIFKRIEYKFEVADFLLLVFSLGIGMQININSLITNGLAIYILVSCVFFGTLLIHFFLAWITKTDVDTLLISSTAALYGPAFIAPVAKSINNRELIIYGIALGLLGYILGNYLGLGFYWILNELIKP